MREIITFQVRNLMFNFEALLIIHIVICCILQLSHLVGNGRLLCF